MTVFAQNANFFTYRIVLLGGVFCCFGQGYVFHKGRFSNQTRLYAAPLTRHQLTIEMISAIATASGIFLRNRTVIYQNCKVGLLCFTFNVIGLAECINVMEKH